jgi:GDP-L-fucose synthase
MEKNSKIFIAGRKGLVGSAIERILHENGYDNIIGMGHKELDLTNQAAVERYFGMERPDYVFLAAAIVGGIHDFYERRPPVLTGGGSESSNY